MVARMWSQMIRRFGVVLETCSHGREVMWSADIKPSNSDSQNCFWKQTPVQSVGIFGYIGQFECINLPCMALVFILSVFIWDLQCKNHFNRKMVFRVTKSQYERQMITYLILHDHPDWGVACGGRLGGAIYMRFQAV